jgi:molybdopterin-containing oxidoreductase family iron-sulfur binding subunit
MSRKETTDKRVSLPVVEENGVSRRDFLRATATAAAAGSYLAGCDKDTREAFFQSHFKELSVDELASVLDRLERTYSKEYGKEFTVGAEPPIEGVLFGYALDIGRCVGCRKCVYACVDENNQSRDPQVHWIRVLEMDRARGVDLHHADAYYDADKVPRPGKFYFPVQCQQCQDPPCVKVCPTEATWKEKDGIVVIDYNWCIGCRCCMSACPYGARHMNWADPEIPKEDVNPVTHYLGNRPRERGVVEKCTFCVQRTRKGRYPACVEVCPVGARKFGNLLDAKSEVRAVLDTQRVFVLKQELDTQPKFFYYWGV